LLIVFCVMKCCCNNKPAHQAPKPEEAFAYAPMEDNA
jgi:hypothetical protein